MKLIADSGGTKTEWCGVTQSSESAVISTAGLNPNFVTEETFAGVISAEVLPGLKTPMLRKFSLWRRMYPELLWNIKCATLSEGLPG